MFLIERCPLFGGSFLWDFTAVSVSVQLPNKFSIADDSREVERSILPVTASTTATSSGASNTTENSAVFQLDLADWAAVGEGVLIPFERVTITGHLGEGIHTYGETPLIRTPIGQKGVSTSARCPAINAACKNCS